MATVAEITTARPETVADLLDRLGNIPADRILLQPPVGTATEKDVIAASEAPHKRLCELIDGTLVEKAMGTPESHFAGKVFKYIDNFLDENAFGVAFGADGLLRLLPGLVRMPDVSFVSWERLPGHQFPTTPIVAAVPDLAVEVLSEGNTKAEMEQKLRDFFQAGVRVAWLIYPKTQTAEVYTSPNEKHRVPKNGSLDGGDVLPGFKLPLRKIFAQTQRRGKKS